MDCVIEHVCAKVDSELCANSTSNEESKRNFLQHKRFEGKSSHNLSKDRVTYSREKRAVSSSGVQLRVESGQRRLLLGLLCRLFALQLRLGLHTKDTVSHPNRSLPLGPVSLPHAVCAPL